MPLPLHHVGGDVRLEVLVNERRTGHEPFLEIDNRINRIDLDDDVAKGIFGDIAAVGDNHGERFTDMAHFVLGKRQLRAAVEDEIRDGRWGNEHRSWFEVIAEILRGEHGAHTRPGGRRGGIDSHDAAVRVFAAHERDVQHPGKLDVVHEQRAAGQEPRVFVPRDPCVKVA